MRAHQAEFRVTTMARVLGVSTRGFYAWLKRPRSAREKSDTALAERVRAIHERSRGTYGAPRIQAELADCGFAVSRKRVARLMRESGLAGISRRKRPTTTRRAASVRPAPDLVDRQFVAEAPDRLWVADITYVPTLAGFVYLSIVLDVFSRRIVGWAMNSSLATDLVLSALEMAIAQRRPECVIHHSDQGSQLGFKGSSQRLDVQVRFRSSYGRSLLVSRRRGCGRCGKRGGPPERFPSGCGNRLSDFRGACGRAV